MLRASKCLTKHSKTFLNLLNRLFFILFMKCSTRNRCNRKKYGKNQFRKILMDPRRVILFDHNCLGCLSLFVPLHVHSFIYNQLTIKQFPFVTFETLFFQLFSISHSKLRAQISTSLHALKLFISYKDK